MSIVESVEAGAESDGSDGRAFISATGSKPVACRSSPGVPVPFCTPGAADSAPHVHSGFAGFAGEGRGLGTCLGEFADEELTELEVQEQQRMEALERQMAALQAAWQLHEARRRRAARELLLRRFTASPLGRMPPALLLPFLTATDVLRWLASAPAVAAQQPPVSPGHTVLHHLRGVAPRLSLTAAARVVARVHWPSLRSVDVDLENPGWSILLEALATSRAVQLSHLQSLGVRFSAERSCSTRQRWLAVEPALLQLGCRAASSGCLLELHLMHFRSADMLTEILRHGGRNLRICRATLIGPESRRQALDLPSEGLPALECLFIRHRDFREQRTSRQDRLALAAVPLLACLGSIRAPERLKVLVLAGICIEGSRQETAALLHGLRPFSGLSALALRFSVPLTFGALLPLPSLLALRCAWGKIGHFVLGDMSMHGFDYWPEQMAESQELCLRRLGQKPEEVFSREFGGVLATQYHQSTSLVWGRMEDTGREFWRHVAALLPSMPCSEVGLRINELFPSGL